MLRFYLHYDELCGFFNIIEDPVHTQVQNKAKHEIKLYTYV